MNTRRTRTIIFNSSKALTISINIVICQRRSTDNPTDSYRADVQCSLKILIFGTSVLNPGAGFLRIFTVAFDRLF